MERRLLTAITAGIGLILLTACTSPERKEHTEEVNPVIANILQRKSVRQYTSRPVDEEKTEWLLRAGMAAPSARDLRPWEFIVIRNRATLDSLAAGLPYGKMLSGAPLAIVVCGDSSRSEKLWVEDCAMVAQNILLAAESLGLGAVFTAVYPYPDRLEIVYRYTRLPENIIPLTIIPVGYPQGVQTPKNKFDKNKIHYETYSR